MAGKGKDRRSHFLQAANRSLRGQQAATERDPGLPSAVECADDPPEQVSRPTPVGSLDAHAGGDAVERRAGLLSCRLDDLGIHLVRSDKTPPSGCRQAGAGSLDRASNCRSDDPLHDDELIGRQWLGAGDQARRDGRRISHVELACSTAESQLGRRIEDGPSARRLGYAGCWYERSELGYDPAALTFSHVEVVVDFMSRTDGLEHDRGLSMMRGPGPRQAAKHAEEGLVRAPVRPPAGQVVADVDDPQVDALRGRERGAGQKQYQCNDDRGGRAAQPGMRCDHPSHPFLEG